MRSSTPFFRTICMHALLRGLPPLQLFADRPTNKQQLQVPFRLAPAYSRRVWRYLTSVVIPEWLAPAIVTQVSSTCR